MKSYIAFVLLLCSLSLPGIADSGPDHHCRKRSAAVEAVPRSDNWWIKRHEEILERVKKGNVDLIFIGDSITHSWEKSPNGGWEDNGEAVWQKYYGHRNAVNMGFSGDRTQHVLWRLDNGEIDGISPKVAVLMIGSNNSNYDWHTSGEMAAGITTIIQRLRTKLPETKILVLGIFPRGEKPSPQRQKNEQANVIVAKYVEAEKKKGNEHVEYMDIGSRFMSADGTLSKDLFPDFLHPSLKGYEIWAAEMEPKLSEMMGEKK